MFTETSVPNTYLEEELFPLGIETETLIIKCWNICTLMTIAHTQGMCGVFGLFQSNMNSYFSLMLTQFSGYIHKLMFKRLWSVRFYVFDFKFLKLTKAAFI